MNRTRNPKRRHGLAGALALGAVLALPLLGTPDTRLEAQRTASASVDGLLAVSPVAGSARLLLGGRLWFQLEPEWRFGGEVRGLTRATRSGSLARGGLEAEFGYGGLVLERTLGGIAPGLAVGTLLGGGSATVVDRATGATVDSDTFVVLEPWASWTLPLVNRTSATVAAGYRQGLGVADLPRVSGSELSGWSLSAGIRLGPF